MYKVNTFIEPHYPVKTKFLKECVAKILTNLKVDGSTEVTVSVVGDRKMRKLNNEFAQVDSSTDVLSFSQLEQIGPTHFVQPPDNQYLNLGDIVISYPQVIKNAIKDNVLVDHSITKLLIHGTLHLLGFDHQNNTDEFAMKKLETDTYKQLALEEVV